MLTFNTDGMLRQSFPLSDPIMDYIFNNVQPQHLLKLYPTCKFFFDKFRKNIIRHLEIVPDGEPQIFDPTKSVICISNPLLKELCDFWITDSFTYRGLPSYFPLSSQFTIKKLELCDYVLWSNFETLTKSGTVKELKIKGVYRGGFLPVEKIIGQVPYATSIEISESIITPATFALLLSLDHKAKISNLVLKNITPPSSYKHHLFVNFLVKNAVENCNVHFDFKRFPEINDEWRALNEKFEKVGKGYCEIIMRDLKFKVLEQKIALVKSMLDP